MLFTCGYNIFEHHCTFTYFLLHYLAQVRLVGGNGVNTGRVEVYYNSTWGTVCDDGWSLNDAAVVCRELGFPRAISSSCCAAFGLGTGTIWLDGVGCTGSETSLSSCSHRGWGRHNCGHNEDAGVYCQGEYTLADILLMCCMQIGTLKPQRCSNVSQCSVHIPTCKYFENILTS